MKPDDPHTGRYCAFCGVDVNECGPAAERFGEPFCSEAHAEEFVRGVRAAWVRATASSMRAAVAPATTGEVEAPAGTQPAGPVRQGWTDRLKKWGCWAAPLGLLLALLLVSSGSGVAAAAGSLLSVLALLACPLAMCLIMRSMGTMNHGQHVNQDRKGSARDGKGA